MLHSSRPRGARFLALCVAGAAALTGAGLAAVPSASAAPAVVPATPVVTGGGFVPVAASRVIDTRLGLGVPKGKVGPNSTIISRLTDKAGLPPAGGATAVVLNLTSANSTTLSYLTAWSAGQAQRPATSSLNFPGGVTRANLVTVPLLSDGRIAIYNAFGYTDVVADVIGYYSATDEASYGGYNPLDAKRYLDTRTEGFRFEDGTYVDLGNNFRDPQSGVDHNPDVTAWVVNVTAVNPTSDGYITAWDGSGERPGTSSVNFKRGMTNANLVEVKRGDTQFDGEPAPLPSFRIAATLFGGSTDVVVDVVGIYTKPGAGVDARFVPLSTPQRIVDTRKAQGPNLRPGEVRTFTESLGTDQTVALAANLTLAQPTTPAYVTVWGSGPKPGISNVNSVKGDIVANGAITEVDPGSVTGGTFTAYNNAGTTPFIVDVTGTFEYIGPAVAAGHAAAAAATADPLVSGTPLSRRAQR